MSALNERQIRYILEIAKEGNLTSAAQKLYISQPSLSGLLASVENELGAKLFDRSANPMKLTYAGEQYVHAAEQILAITNDLKRKINRDSTLNIGCSLACSPLVFPQLLPALIERFPDININLLEYDREELERRLLSRTLDLAIFACEDNKRNNSIDYVPISKGEFLLFTAPSKRLNRHPDPANHDDYYVDLKDFKDETFILLKSGRQVRDVIDQLFEMNHMRPGKVIETDNWRNCISLTEKGFGCTILPDYPTTESFSNVSRSKLKHPVFRELLLCSLKEESHSDLLKEAGSFIVDFTRNTTE